MKKDISLGKEMATPPEFGLEFPKSFDDLPEETFDMLYLNQIMRLAEAKRSGDPNLDAKMAQFLATGDQKSVTEYLLSSLEGVDVKKAIEDLLPSKWMTARDEYCSKKDNCKYIDTDEGDWSRYREIPGEKVSKGTVKFLKGLEEELQRFPPPGKEFITFHGTGGAELEAGKGKIFTIPHFMETHFNVDDITAGDIKYEDDPETGKPKKGSGCCMFVVDVPKEATNIGYSWFTMKVIFPPGSRFEVVEDSNKKLWYSFGEFDTIWTYHLKYLGYTPMYVPAPPSVEKPVERPVEKPKPVGGPIERPEAKKLGLTLLEDRKDYPRLFLMKLKNPEANFFLTKPDLLIIGYRPPQTVKGARFVQFLQKEDSNFDNFLRLIERGTPILGLPYGAEGPLYWTNLGFKVYLRDKDGNLEVDGIRYKI
jgi:hypothetical protein